MTRDATASRLGTGALALLLFTVLSACPESPVEPAPDGGTADGRARDANHWDLKFCVPKCEGKPCGGDDGCGDPCPSGYCTLGQRCDQGRCVCDGSSCPEGCCLDDSCFLGTADTHCGTGGSGCVDCLSAGQSCGAEQACFACTPQCANKNCGAPNGCGGICSAGACPSGQICSGGQCVCSAASCAGGCCKDNLCYPGSEDSHCGTGGALCSDCRPSQQSCLIARICGCVPDCAGKACGADDGCGNACQSGSCASGQTCVQGVCECNAQSCPTGCCDSAKTCRSGTEEAYCGGGGASCASCTSMGLQCVDRDCANCTRWRVGPISAYLLDATVDTDGTTYVVGAAGSSLQLLRISPCGAIEAQRVHLGTNRSRLIGRTARLVSGSLWVGGDVTNTTTTDPDHGYYGRYDKTQLSEQFGSGLGGSVGKDEVRDMVWTGSHFFMTGTADVGGSQHYWGLKATTSQACGFRVVPGEEAAVGRAALHDPSGFVYLLGNRIGFAHIARYGVNDCAVAPCQACPPPWTMEFKVDNFGTEARDAVVVGGSLYVAGFYMENGTDRQGFLAKVDIATKSVSTIFRYRPTTRHDLIESLVSDGTRLYVAASKDLALDYLSGGSAVVMAFDYQLNKLWELAPGDPRSYVNIDLSGTDGLILTGGETNAGYIRRCLRSGAC